MPRLKSNETTEVRKLLYTVEEMSKISGIGQCFLRDLIEQNKIEYVSIGTKKMLHTQSVLNWYEANKVHAKN